MTACESAWGSDAKRHAKSLRSLIWVGSFPSRRFTSTILLYDSTSWLPDERHSERQPAVLLAATSRFFWFGLARLSQPYARP
jgi:hypothetical protein